MEPRTDFMYGIRWRPSCTRHAPILHQNHPNPSTSIREQDSMPNSPRFYLYLHIDTLLSLLEHMYVEPQAPNNKRDPITASLRLTVPQKRFPHQTQPLLRLLKHFIHPLNEFWSFSGCSSIFVVPWPKIRVLEILVHFIDPTVIYTP